MEYLDLLQTGGVVGIVAVVVQAIKYLLKEKILVLTMDVYTAKRQKTEIERLTRENERLVCHQTFLQGELKDARNAASKLERSAERLKLKLEEEKK